MLKGGNIYVVQNCFLCVDGTLIDYKKGVMSVTTISAIQQLLAKGIKVVAATGRPLSMCTELQQLGIETFITANGAYAKHQETVIFSSIVDRPITEAIDAYAKQKGHALSFFTETLTMNGIQNAPTWQALQQTLSLKEYPPVDPFITEKDIYLMCLYADSRNVAEYKEAFPHLLFEQWHPTIANVLQREVSKAIAAKAVLQYFGCKPEEAVAFGDGENDIELLGLAGFGVAMGNGSDKLKQIADFVTQDCDKDGIAFALKDLELIH